MVLLEQNLAHSWQKSATQTGTRCMSQRGITCVSLLCLAVCIHGQV